MRVDESLDEQRVQGCLNILCDIGGFGDIECEVLEPGHAVLAFNTSSAMRNPYGDLHGGFYMTVSDMAACMAVYTNGSKPVTLQCNFNFCEGIHVNGQRVTVDARV
ncbi:PaaI family thioesterase, partial [Slackia piriformis]|uniref:PaaI family thioesterase n=1 Tax=Slackia piriformis TaxID=626934 RepID=UPI0024904013